MSYATLAATPAKVPEWAWTHLRSTESPIVLGANTGTAVVRTDAILFPASEQDHRRVLAVLNA
jgi:hypothetical protein